MRAALVAALATVASAATLPRDVPPEAPNNVIPVFVTRTWPLLSPESALASLHSKAAATPSAVSILPGVPVPSDLAAKIEKAHADAAALEKAAGFTALGEPKSGAHPETESLATSNAHSEKLAASDATAATCTNPAIVYEWRNLSDTHKGQFVSAIKCLLNTKARSGLPNTVNRMDDLTAIHQHMSNIIHNVGQFLPWHRYFLWIFEQELRNTCHYTGPMTWWDETKDAGNFHSAPMFTSQYYGSMPVGSTQCITNGAFGGTTCHIGPGSSNTNHCLSRDCNEQTSSAITSNFVKTCQSYTDFESMNNCVFFGPHGYGHDAVGAVMSDVQSSPGDPTFYLHHGFVDHMWRIWQNLKPSNQQAIGGYTTQNCGNNCQATTLQYTLSSMNFYPSVPISQVISTEQGMLCYKYDY